MCRFQSHWSSHCGFQSRGALCQPAYVTGKEIAINWVTGQSGLMGQLLFIGPG